MSGTFESPNSVLVQFDDREAGAVVPPVPMSDAQRRRLLGRYLLSENGSLAGRPDLGSLRQLAGEQAEICERAGDLRGLWTALCNQALLANAQGDRSVALTLLERAEHACRQANDSEGLNAAIAIRAALVGSESSASG